MLTSKANLFGQGWIDAVFEGRNKEYGAYDLRKRESWVTLWAFAIGATIFVSLVSAPLLLRTINGSSGDPLEGFGVILKPSVLTPPPPKAPPVTIPKQTPPTVKSAVAIKKITPLVVAPGTEATDVVPTQASLIHALSGTIDTDGEPGGVIPIDQPVARTTTAGAITERPPIPLNHVQVAPEYPGGLAKFFEYVMWNMGGVAVEDGKDLRMQFRFVIERDGRLTGVQVVDDGGHPDIAERAREVLEKSAKWSPGVNDGIAVRVAYILPIVIKPAQ